MASMLPAIEGDEDMLWGKAYSYSVVDGMADGSCWSCPIWTALSEERSAMVTGMRAAPSVSTDSVSAK